MEWLSSLGIFGSILRVLILILEVILVFNLMIVVHEWGHFLAARWRGLKVEKFYVWFGKPLWKKTMNGVEYGLGTIPFGGYVALPQMAPMGGIEGESNSEGLPPITPLDKAIVAVAGPLFSFLLACVFAVAVWQVGKPQSEAFTTTTVGYVGKESPAAQAGLLPGDVILKVDGEPVRRFEGLVDSVRWSVVASEGDTIPFEIDRGGKKMTLNVDPKAWPASETKAAKPSWWSSIFKRPELRSVGVSGKLTPLVGHVDRYSPAEKAGIQVNDEILKVDGVPLLSPMGLTEHIETHKDQPTFTLDIRRKGQPLQLTVAPRVMRNPEETNDPELKDKRIVGMVWDLDGLRKVTHPSPREQVTDAVRHMGNLVQKLFSPKSDLSPAHMSGPLGVGRLYYKLLQHPDGWRMVLWFSVVFNINLAILNMLPFPVLDGGHITMAIAEAIRRKPPQGRLLEYVQTACALLLFGFIIFVTLKDTGDISGGGESGEPVKTYRNFKPD